MKKNSLLGLLLYESKRFILRIKTLVGDLRFEASKALLWWNFAGFSLRHKEQERGRLLPMAASTDKALEADPGHGIGWCDGCLRTYDVVILAKGEQVIFDNFTRGRFRVFLREGDLPQFCPRCWKRLEFEELAKEFEFSKDFPMVFRYRAQLPPVKIRA